MYVACSSMRIYCVHERADERGFADRKLIVARLYSMIDRDRDRSIFHDPLCSLLYLFFFFFFSLKSTGREQRRAGH